ncbi:MAG: hypothetical protein JNM07_05780 [Phycisphaerae bacterium]|nr:hypothetical protein [Phycisphaerae bacterium]
MKVLWASRYGWGRYWSALRAEYEREARKYSDRSLIDMSQQYELLKSLRDYADTNTEPMPHNFEQLVAQIVKADQNCDESRDSIEETAAAKGILYHSIYGVGLSKASHASPQYIIYYGNTASSVGRYHVALHSALYIVRAVHISMKWSQRPAFWAYNWITRGVRDPEEGRASGNESYGTLGLPCFVQNPGATVEDPRANSSA